MPKKPQAKLHIQGHVPSGKHINVWIVLDETTGRWEVRKGHDNADNEEPITGDPPGLEDIDVIIEQLGYINPCWVRTRRGWINIC